ncbi:hypothetical protein [Xylanimonas protaetiae]|uniref:Integral membrane protein n=1 Tax=Xylanimonas protaetiae TaxID=2509457 RepID=A0A4P6F5E5_9MICO|nr:hypothetical protein [Xylanimonas protaetiae]QAY71180.1 hypothetical protein ET471_14990 [Xylanimonas protaetiae]
MDLETARQQNVLELRIHGISNTPPWGILDVGKDEVVTSEGDSFGTFWELTPAADARDRRLRPGQLHHIPPDVRREAYSWGAMARAVLPTGAGTAARVWAAVIRAMRAGVVPFGLTNAGYWARRVPRTPADRVDHGSAPEPTAAMVRLFGLAMTFLMVSAATTVAVLLVGAQCYADVAGRPSTCREVPGLGFLGSLERGPRAAVLSLVPVLVIVALVTAGRSTQAKFDERVSAARAGEGLPRTAGPLLYRPGFWARRPSGPTMLVTQLGASMALVAVLLSWTSTRLAVQTGVMIAAAAVIGVAALLVCLRTDDYGVEVTPAAWRGAASFVVLGAGFATWVLAAVVSAAPQWFTDAQVAAPTYVGIRMAPSVVGVFLIAVAATGLVWRHSGTAALVGWTLVPVLATAATAVLALTRNNPQVSADVRDALLFGATGLIALPALVALGRRARRTHPHEGWNGSGPGIFLLAATGLGSVYSSLTVLGARSLLDGDQELQVPSAFAEFAMASVLILALVVVQLVVVALPSIGRVVGKNPRWIPASPGTVGDRRGPTAWSWVAMELAEWETDVRGRGVKLLRRRPAGERPYPADAVNPVGQRVQRHRQQAALAQRGEIAVNVVAAACFLALLAAVLIAVREDAVAGIVLSPTVEDFLMARLAVPSVGLITTALVASAVSGITTRATVAVDVLWDLLCFLPRSAHPLGPASYAERAVPEIRGRVDAWLHGADLPASTPAERAERSAIAARRRVVLSAHSMGSTIAVAAVLIRAGNPVPSIDVGDDVHDPMRADDVVEQHEGAPDRGDRHVGLLSFGSQVRAYFGRFFPELFGPATLGTRPCTGPAWRGDPWARQTTTTAVDHEPPPASLADVLAGGPGLPAWVNLWRRTDVLGFPVDSYAGSPIDRGAEEVDRGSYLLDVDGHSTYWRALAYDRGFAEVLSRLAPVPPLPPAPAAPPADDGNHVRQDGRPARWRAFAVGGVAGLLLAGVGARLPRRDAVRRSAPRHATAADA